MSGNIRLKHTFRLKPDLSKRLAEFAARKRVSQALIVETAIESFLSPDGSERIEAAISRRLDRMGRQWDRVAWNLDLTNETLALFIRFWLTANAPLPDTALAAAQAMGRERWERFVTALSRRMEKGPRLSSELATDVTEDEALPTLSANEAEE